MSFSYLYKKPGWAILVTYCDGSSGFMSAEGTAFPKIWPHYDREGAVRQVKKMRVGEGPKARVVKVKATWPKIV